MLNKHQCMPSDNKCAGLAAGRVVFCFSCLSQVSIGLPCTTLPFCCLAVAGLLRTSGRSTILRALPASSLTSLSVKYEEELDEVPEDLHGIIIPALTALTKLQHVK